ncbi:MAG: hypothetical protein SFV81_10190 [Pirellulaceae bacterium]|nr:hypothetical protein [Pirellulaceae bacterium]
MEGVFRRRNLPHWDVLGQPVFITGCLHGSISQAGIKQINGYRDHLKRKPRPATFSIDDWEHHQQKQLFAFVDNPVKAGLVESPEQYRWSSAHYRALGNLPGRDSPTPRNQIS